MGFHFGKNIFELPPNPSPYSSHSPLSLSFLLRGKKYYKETRKRKMRLGKWVLLAIGQKLLKTFPQTIAKRHSVAKTIVKRWTEKTCTPDYSWTLKKLMHRSNHSKGRKKIKQGKVDLNKNWWFSRSITLKKLLRK